MKTDNRTPSDIIQYIGEIINERQKKSLPTYYTISIEQYEKITPVAEKEEGYDNFKQEVLKYMSDYNLTAIKVDLYSGKSRNVKSPFQSFKVVLKKQTPAVFLGNYEKEQTPEVQQLDSSISVSRHYEERFDLQIRIMRSEMENQSLSDKMVALTERYEEKLKELDLRNADKIKLLLEEIEELEGEIKELEEDIAKTEKEKHNSIGNLALGSIGARAIEGFAKSDMGRGVLKGVLGDIGYESLQGHLAGIENERNNIAPEKPTARIVPDEAESTDPRQIALNYIQKIGQALPDVELRMLYDITEITAKNIADLPVLWKIAQQIIQQRGKAKAPSTKEAEEEQEEEEDSEQEDTNKIE